MKQLFIACMFFAGSAAFGFGDLKDISTQIGADAAHPTSPFVKCAIEAAIHVAYGNARGFVMVAFTMPFEPNSISPEQIAILFLSKDVGDNNKVDKLILTSNEKDIRWQIEESNSETYYYSRLVSPFARFLTRDSQLLAEVDLSNCR